VVVVVGGLGYIAVPSGPSSQAQPTNYTTWKTCLYLENDCCCYIGWQFGVAVALTLNWTHWATFRVYQER